MLNNLDEKIITFKGSQQLNIHAVFEWLEATDAAHAFMQHKTCGYGFAICHWYQHTAEPKAHNNTRISTKRRCNLCMFVHTHSHTLKHKTQRRDNTQHAHTNNINTSLEHWSISAPERSCRLDKTFTRLMDASGIYVYYNAMQASNNIFNETV